MIQLSHYSAFIKRKNPDNASTKIKLTNGLFFALCCYLIAQCYTIPLLPIGPWAVWPNLADIAAGLLVMAFLLNFRQTPQASKANQRIFVILMFTLMTSILSYMFYVSYAYRDVKGIKFGIFQIYRLVEFISVFWITARVPLTPRRINTLSRIIDIVLVLVCLGIFLTSSSIVPLDALTTHLPQDQGVAGPWASFAKFGSQGIARGWGTIGYNHGYVAAQVLMLVSLRIHLSHGKRLRSDNIFLLISIVSCFLTQSRAGLVAILLFALVYWLKQPFQVLASIFAMFLGTIPLLIILANILSNIKANDDNHGSILDRQLTLLDPTNSESLSGRDAIWIGTIESLEEKPIRWILGTGFGSAPDFAGDGAIGAHMLILQIVLETGVVGLFVFAILFFYILNFLYQHEPREKAIFWVTVAFLITSVSQDTFYPTPAFGHFLGFYLCAVAIVLRNKSILDTRQIF